ncbi:hypothetical protein SAMD00019534_042420 [Acytostelium subglobosum LB1]|uniref:hypothetical protein n=1 Tax=Acytostelium subglobosum LB1 TaxID=1410327 RepID=UPI000644EF22|nr:hypothetical protein SAMD00019534_042420 [Acytostelium subglobosum LB1]GAM21067.1 hypothetical protein SAMD00019534_042420 [Acytostelium subglobosum LB1]|eukprot:XP_012756201.1 hypothetical protein SAMD00019534_042420 [Acytostelium subglobosum LB1]
MAESYVNLDKRSAAISKTETREKNGKKFTEYIVDIVVDNGEEYSIARRFSEFLALNQLMVHNFQIKYPFPPKKLNKLNATLVESRRKSLQEFLQHLITCPTASVRRSTDLARFLDPTNPVFTNKLVHKKVTLEDVNKRKQMLEITVVEGKDIKQGAKSMWDIVSYCVYDVDKQPEETNTFIGHTYRTPTIPGPYPNWNYRQTVNIKDKKKLYLKVYSSLDTNSTTNTNNIANGVAGGESTAPSVIGTAELAFSSLSLNNYSPTTHSLPLEPKGSGELLLSFILV